MSVDDTCVDDTCVDGVCVGVCVEERVELLALDETVDKIY